MSTKTVEKYVADGKLRQATQARLNLPPIAVIHPDDLAQLMSSRQTAAEQRPPGSEIATRREPAPAAAAFMQAVLDMRRPNLKDKVFLSVKEASSYSGLPPIFLRRLIAEGRLEAVVVNKSGSVRIRRRDLDAL